MTTALTTTDQNQTQAVQEFSAFGNISHFENAQRMAKALCSSSIVPINFQGDQNIGSCLIALEISNRIGMSVLAVMQNMFLVHGKPGWSAQFLISCVNASKKFSPLRYKMTGEKGKDSWGCIAWAQDKTGEVLESPEVTIEMAKAEGWYSKNGSKWKTMPELMLRYRTATLFARLYAPELTMGIQTTDELNDVIDVDSVATPVSAVKTPQFPEPPMLSAPPQVTPPTPRKRRTNIDNIAPVDVPPAAPVPTPAATPEPTFEQVVDGDLPANTDAIGKLQAAIAAAKIDENYAIAESKTVAYFAAHNLLQEGQLQVLRSVIPSKVDSIIKMLPHMAGQIKEMGV